MLATSRSNDPGFADFPNQRFRDDGCNIARLFRCSGSCRRRMNSRRPSSLDAGHAGIESQMVSVATRSDVSPENRRDQTAIERPTRCARATLSDRARESDRG